METHEEKQESAGLEDVEEKVLSGVKDARASIESFARENPRLSVGIALGIGYVLGGGLTPRILFGLGALAARRYASSYARERLAELTRGAKEGASNGGRREPIGPADEPSPG
jgi:hypothetical protein